MATTYESPTIDQVVISATKAGEVVANSGSVDFGAASTSYVSGDLAICVNLPAFHVPVEIIGDIQDADSGTTLVFDCGFVGNDDGADDDQDAFGASYSTGQAGGVFRATSKNFSRIAAADHDRKIGLKVTTIGVCPATVPEVTLTVLARRAITGRD